jgi:hypothetical protein
MGTRNLTCVVKNGEFKVAQYCQWDGYPSGQGETIVEFIQRRLQDSEGLTIFNQRVLEVSEITIDELKAKWVECSANPNSDMVSMEVSHKFNEKYPQYHRDFGARILDYVFDNPNAKVRLDVEFAGESLFCEWAYVLDLDNNVLEVYKGFNKEPLKSSERFAQFFQKKDHRQSEQYHPVKLFESIPFSEVNDETVAKLEAKYNAED